jgi:ribosome-dependent ATPase
MSAAAAGLAVIASQVGHRYKKVVGLDNLDVTLVRGRFHAIVGPDGVGKSTLLALIAAAKRLQGGSLAVLGSDVRSAGARRELAHRVAYMPQGLGRNLYPDLTIAEHLDYFAVLFGVGGDQRSARGEMLLRRTGLAGFEDRRARNLSGGMKQKLALCCSLIHEPEMLVLDEPTTGVDPLSRREFWDLLKEARLERPDLTVICSTGYIDEAVHFDEIAFVHGGRLLLQGSVEEIRDRSPDKSLSGAYATILGENGVAPTLADRPVSNRPPSDEIVIEAKGLSKRFGTFTAVDSINLSVRHGEIFAFLGPNGRRPAAASSAPGSVI